MFFGEHSPSSSSTSLSNVIFENDGNDLNNEANPNTSEIKPCLSSEGKRNKTKRDRHPKYLKIQISIATARERLFL